MSQPETHTPRRYHWVGGATSSLLAAAVGYYALSRLGLAFIDEQSSVAVIWLASGFALAALLVSERRFWPVVTGGIFLGSLVAQLQDRGQPLMGLSISLVNAAAPAAAALVVLSFVRGGASPTRRLGGVLLAIVTANAATSAIGAGLLALQASPSLGVEFTEAWPRWFLSDGLGYLLIAPMAVAYSTDIDVRHHRVEQVLIGVAAVLISLMIFQPVAFDGVASLPYPFLIFPILLWSAQRGGLPLTSIVLATTGVIAAAGVATGNDPFVNGVVKGIGAGPVMTFQIWLTAMVVCTMLVSATVAERAHHDAVARAEQERVNSILRAATEYAVIATDVVDGRITFFNEGAERLLGFSAESMIGRRLVTALHIPSEVTQRMTELGLNDPTEVLTWSARNGISETRGWTYRRRDGSTVPVVLTFSPEYDRWQQLAGFVGIARDISEQRRFEHYVADSLERERAMFAQLRASNDLRSEFVSSVSHELRTPLTNVLGYTEVLLAGDLGLLDTRQADALRLVDRNSQRLLRLVEDLLALTQMSEPLSDADPVEVSLRSIVHDARLTVGLDAERNGVTIVIRHADDVTVVGDAAQLERVFVNILSNAIRFSSEGGMVEMSLTADRDAVVTITDDGPGMSDVQLDRVFERFFRVDDAEPRSGQGSGLGLPIAKGIVERHGGTISVESSPGAGTRVVVTLPAALSGLERPATNHFAPGGQPPVDLARDDSIVGSFPLPEIDPKSAATVVHVDGTSGRSGREAKSPSVNWRTEE